MGFKGSRLELALGFCEFQVTKSDREVYDVQPKLKTRRRSSATREVYSPSE